MAKRLDRLSPISFGATPVRVTEEGFRHYEGTATIGDVVLPYQQPTAHLEFRPAEEVASEAAVESMVGKPVTFEHPPDLLSPDTAKEHTEGTVLAAWREEGPDGRARIRVRVVVYTRALQEAIEGGKVELSPGYNCDPVEAPGEFQGQKFHVVQRGHRYNHLAVVDRARTRTPTGEVARLDKDDTTMADKKSEAPEGEEAAAAEDKMDEVAIPNLSEKGNALFAQMPPDDQKMIIAWKASYEGEEAEKMAMAEGKSLEEAEAIEENVKAAASGEAAGESGEPAEGGENAGGAGEEEPMQDKIDMKAIDARLAKMEAAIEKMAGASADRKDSDTRTYNRSDAAGVTVTAAELAKMRSEAAAEALKANRAERRLLATVRADSADLLKGDDADAAFVAMVAEVKRSAPDFADEAAAALKARRFDSVERMYNAAVTMKRRAIIDADMGLLGNAIFNARADESGDEGFAY